MTPSEVKTTLNRSIKTLTDCKYMEKIQMILNSMNNSLCDENTRNLLYNTAGFFKYKVVKKISNNY